MQYSVQFSLRGFHALNNIWCGFTVMSGGKSGGTRIPEQQNDLVQFLNKHTLRYGEKSSYKSFLQPGFLVKNVIFLEKFS